MTRPMEWVRPAWGRLAPRDRRAILLGSAMLVVILCLWGLDTGVARWLDARQRVDAAQRELTQLDGKLRRLSLRQEQLIEKFGPGVVKPLQDVPAATMELLKAVPEALKQAGVQSKGTLPQPVRPVRELPGVCAVPLQVKAACQLPQLAKCLESLRTGETLVIVEQVLAIGDPKKPGQLEVTLVLATLARDGKAGP